MYLNALYFGIYLICKGEINSFKLMIFHTRCMKNLLNKQQQNADGFSYFNRLACTFHYSYAICANNCIFPNEDYYLFNLLIFKVLQFSHFTFTFMVARDFDVMHFLMCVEMVILGVLSSLMLFTNPQRLITQDTILKISRAHLSTLHLALH